ncbi:coiled-coil domain-containing protein 138-like [Centropristis striata]|uniref:coiled-coil domain-containing protein 138-like n=1 Tax=Centropristis striata TaxID=184440 RepID=UPI0027E1358D|nr:coiled-coil domain-containing protein 138-like [Centropristis striata]
MNQFKDTNGAETVEKLQKKYSDRRKQLLLPEDTEGGSSDEAVRQLVLANRSKQPNRDFKCSSKALTDLFRAVRDHPDQFSSDHGLHESNEDLSEDSIAPHQDSQVLFTETDVTLPSCLDGSPGSYEAETDRDLERPGPDSGRSSSLVLVRVYQEMITVYQQLKAERRGQQQWEKELQERERRLQQQEEERERRLKEQEEIIQTHIAAVEEKHQQEVNKLQELLRERNKETRRLKSSFDSIKELNDNMKKQLNEISEQNQRLESQWKRVQARLENLQRKYEHSISLRVCQRVSVKSSECINSSKKEKSASSGKKPSCKKSGSSPVPVRLLVLLLDWVLEGQKFSSETGNEEKGVDQSLPPDVSLNERCLKVLPLLADQLHQTPSSEPELLLQLLRLIHWTMRHNDSSTQQVALPATLRRIGQEVSKPPVQLTGGQPGDLDRSESCRSWSLYLSPCPHTRVLSSLIVLRTVTQADVVAQVLDSLRSDLRSEDSRGLFIHYGGVCVLLWMLRAGRGGRHTPVDVLLQLTGPSRYLNLFLEACSCEQFFQTASQILKKPDVELRTLEQISILLQKLSGIRRNRRLFELSSLHLQIQELNQRNKHTHTFLCLNLQSILHNLH